MIMILILCAIGIACGSIAATTKEVRQTDRDKKQRRLEAEHRRRMAAARRR